MRVGIPFLAEDDRWYIWRERVFYFPQTGPLGPHWRVFEMQTERGRVVAAAWRRGID